jgi:chain length determinant protein tyrosine kinase EpsG
MKANVNEDIRQLENPQHNPASSSLGAILVAAGKLSQSDTLRVMDLQRREGWRFGEAAQRLNLISERDLIHALHKQYDLPLLFLAEKGQLSEELVVAHQPYHRRTEELRALRTQLLIRWFRRTTPSQHILAVVSPGDDEGRSYVAANLAVLFSQLGERTLLIDADLRNPSQHRIFNLASRVGLSSVLAGRTHQTDATMAVAGFQNLMVLPAGAVPPNPLELLSRPALPALLGEYMNNFDVIIMDTPPALRYSDAHTVAFNAGNAMVLTRKDCTRLVDSEQVIRELGNGSTRVIGTVINAF